MLADFKNFLFTIGRTQQEICHKTLVTFKLQLTYTTFSINNSETSHIFNTILSAYLQYSSNGTVKYVGYICISCSQIVYSVGLSHPLTRMHARIRLRLAPLINCVIDDTKYAVPTRPIMSVRRRFDFSEVDLLLHFCANVL